MDTSHHLDKTFAALANPTRRAILARLAQGNATVNTLAEPFDMSLPAVSKHIRVLEDAGLITRGKDAQFRPCTLNADPIEAVASWTDGYRHIWDKRFEAMGHILNSMRSHRDE